MIDQYSLDSRAVIVKPWITRVCMHVSNIYRVILFKVKVSFIEYFQRVLKYIYLCYY